MNRNNKEETTVKSLKIEKFKSLNLAALFIASVTLASCSSDDGDSEPKNVLEAGKTYILTVDARKGSDVTTRALNLSGSTLNATWAKGEKVFVKQYDNWLGGFLSPDANGETARLNGEINNITGELPQYLFLQYPRQTWNYTGQDGTIADIAANFDYATATAHITEIYGSNISASSSVTFTNQQAIVKFTLKDKNNNDAAINAKSLRISASGLAQSVDVSHSTNVYTFTNTPGDITITPASATSEIFAALRGISEKQVRLTATDGTNTYVYSKNDVTFTHGKYYEITVKMKKITEGIELSAVTSDYIGCIVGQNGKVYSTRDKAEAANTTAVAMVAYVSSTGKGLAIALADESGQMNQSEAITAVSGKTAVSGGTWRLPSTTDWQSMLIGCGNGASTNQWGEVDATALTSKLATLNASLQTTANYWSSVEFYAPHFVGTTVNLGFGDINDGYSLYNVRACLAFPEVTQ